MSHRIQESADAVVLAPATQASASVIWLHGLGADGNDFVPIVPELKLPPAPGLRFVFPHASVRPVTLNMGMRMRAWYDIKTLTAEGRADEPGIRESVGVVGKLIAAERALGIASERIVIAGFSRAARSR
jgi:phospholipase/carboxylesterase